MAVPTLVQHTHFYWTTGNAVTVCNFPIPNAVRSGNAIIIFLNNATGGGPSTVTDDQSGTYTLAGTAIDNSSQRLSIYYRLNVTNAPKKIIITYSPARAYVNCAISEYRNVATVSAADGYNTNSGAGTAMTAGSITPSTSGALILAGFVQTSVDSPITSFTAGGSFSHLSADVLGMLMVEALVHTSGAINPSATQSPTNNWIGACIALKEATAGTDPGTGIRIQRLQHNGLNSIATSPRTINCPCSGNLLVATWCGVTLPEITGITDTNGNTWVQHPNSPLPFSQVIGQMWYVENAVTSPGMQVTITFTGTPTSGSMFQFFDVVNSKTPTSLDVTSFATGFNDTTPSWEGASITPTTANSLIIMTMTVDSFTTIALSPGQFLSSTNPNEETSPWPNDQNDGLGCFYNPDTSIYESTWTSDVAPAGWLELQAVFVSQPAVTLTGVTPNTGAQGATALELTLTGTRFTGV